MEFKFSDVLSRITAEKIEYFKTKNIGRNSESLRRINELVRNKRYIANNFEAEEVDFESFSWQRENMDRNWWWQTQSFPFLAWYVNARELLTEDEKLKIIQFCEKSVLRWIEIEDCQDPNNLVWHDHAASFRLSNLFNWLFSVFIDVKSGRLADDTIKEKDQIINFIYKHIAWISKDENYSKNTNHGLDQASSVMFIGFYTCYPEWANFFDLATQRLHEELEFAFTPEGVHKENSPAYHMFMLGRLKLFSELSKFENNNFVQKAVELEDKAKLFLQALALPNGLLPMLGDTKDGLKVADNHFPAELSEYDFCESGYFIIKGLVAYKPFYLLVKNCFDSSYHRHDDDLHMILYYGDEVLLGDGGLGAHAEQDPRRKELRSYNCHNVPIIKHSTPTRNLSQLLHKPSLSYNSVKKIVTGTSYLFGCKLNRYIDLARVNEGIISISDSAMSEKGSLLQNYIFPQGDSIRTNFDCNNVDLFREGEKLLSFEFDEPLKSVKTKKVAYSIKYGVYEKRLSLQFEGQNDNCLKTKLIFK